MNVIVSNKQKEIIDNSNIDAIKDLNGLFNVEDLINNFRNYFFSKMIVDATSIVEFANPNVLKKLVDGIGAEKLIILLPSRPEPPKKFLSLLVRLGVYNFSSNIDDIVKFLQKPNTYDDVKEYLNDGSILNRNNFERLDNNVGNANSNGFSPNNLPNNNSNDTPSNFKVVDYMDNTSVNNPLDPNTNNGNMNTFNKPMPFINNEPMNIETTKFTLGIKNVTEHAGTTSLIYMLKQCLEYKFNKKVLAIETGSNDFMYYEDNNMISVASSNVENAIKNAKCDVVLVDLNNSNYEAICNDVIYLVEPSIIKINKLMANNRKAFDSLKNKKIVLNKSLLSNTDIDVFAHEANVPFFFAIPPLNDRVGNSILETLIAKLNIDGNANKHGFLGFFGKNS